MKVHTSEFKEQVKELGRELDSIITYELNGETIELGNETLNSITPVYEGSLLKSVMKQLDLDSLIDIPLDTIINFRFGVKVRDDDVEDYRDNYDYVDFGNYVVFSSEKQEDLNSYKIVCYDKMLYSMKDYDNTGITYPITVREYITKLCNNMDLTFKNENDYFVNSEQTIEKELYLDEDGNSLGYTFRDVLDDLAEVTASTICINNNDKLEIRYIQNIGEYETATGTTITIPNVEDSKDLKITLKGNSTQNGTPTPSSPVAVESVTGRQEIDVVGKNLLQTTYTSQSTTSYGISYVINEDKSITLNGTNTSGSLQYIRVANNFVIPAGTYTLSNSNSNVSDSSAIFYDDNYNFSRANVSTKTFTEAKTIKPYVRIAVGATFNNFTIYPMIEKNNIDTSYEPYIEQINEINLGKNLFDINGTIGNNNGCSVAVNDSTIKVTTTTSGTYRYGIIRLPFFKELLGKQVTLSGETTFSNNSCDPAVKLYSYNSNGNVVTYYGELYNKSEGFKTITIDSTVSGTAVGLELLFYVTTSTNSSVNDYAEYKNIQLEYGAIATSYSSFFTPIELCKIGTYQDRIFKSKGINLANDIFSDYDSSNASYSIYPIKLEQGATYTLKATLVGEKKTSYYNYGIVKDGTDYGTFVDLQTCVNYSTGNTSTITFTTDNTYTNPKLVCFVQQSETKFNELFTNYQIQLEKGSSATEYEPYGEPSWYIKKWIGKVILNGSENWGNSPLNLPELVDVSGFTLNNASMFGTNNLGGLCDRLIYDYSYRGNYEHFYIYNNYLYFYVSKTIATTKAELTSWLANNNTTIHYVSPAPTYTKIENEELIEQLENIRLLYGINNITSSVPIDLTYLSSRDTIDEEYLKDINVNFGEKYGPINSIVLSRSAESDSIYKKDEQSIAQNGLNEFKIIDNQILNDNTRDLFINDIFYKLNGVEFYLNDFSSTGIVYYDLLDKYNITIGDKNYACLMLNDEVDITQGLEEHINTPRPEESETDYKKADTTDRKINQAYLIVDKTNATIQGLTSKVENIETEQGNFVRTSTFETFQEGNTLTLNSMQQDIKDGKENLTNKMVTINDDGITVSTESSKIETNMDNNAFTIKTKDDVELAKFGYDTNLQQSVSRMDNLTVTTFFISGNHRQQKYGDSDERTGWFYVGGGN